MLAAANRVKDGNASEEDILKVKEFTLDRDRKTSWGYKTINLIAHIPAYALEFGRIATLGGYAKFKGVVAGSKMATRSAILKAVEDASATVTAKVATSAAEKAAVIKNS